MSECIILHRKRRVVLIPESHTEPLPVRESDHRVLSLHRETPPDDRATTEAPPEAPGHGRKEKERRAKARRRAARLQLLHDHWPALFAVTRPLKVGIKDDLIQDAQQRQLGLKPNDIGLGLREWVRRRVYFKALVYGDGRYDIRGELVAPLSDEHRQLARESLDRLDQAWEARQQADHKQAD